MKIVCDACQAKYSISDDKVQGKVFKIRCKKCSNIIVVRGGAGAEPAPAPAQEKETRVYDYGYEGGDQAPAGDDAVWHVVINQEQVGPMTAAEVQQRFAGGELDAESYIWREGFADWLPISQVDTFAAYVQSGSTTTAASPGSDAVASMFGGGGLGDEAGTVRSDPGDLFAAASSSSRASDDDGGDLFGRQPSASREPQAAAGSKLRGERNENSVLFSLGNLAQLASDRPAPAPSSSSSSSGGAGHATGAAGGEGSGLIDIRSMANAYLGGSGAGGAVAKPASAGIGSIDDLPVFGGGGFSEPAVMVPVAARANNSKMMYALIGSVGALAVAAIILVIVMVRGGGDKDANKKDERASEQLAVNDSDRKADSAAPDSTKPDPGEPAAPSKPDPASEPPPSKPDPASEPPPSRPDPRPAKPDTTKPKNPPPAPKPGIAAAKPEPVKPAKPDKPEKPAAGGCDEVSCVISSYEGACCAKYKKGGSTGGNKPTTQIGEKPRSDVPETLDRTMISDGVNKVKARVMACGEKSNAKGQVKVSVKVNPDGSISSVTVKNTPDPGLGNCVAAAMQKASFKKTQTGGSFGYPFVF